MKSLTMCWKGSTLSMPECMYGGELNIARKLTGIVSAKGKTVK